MKSYILNLFLIFAISAGFHTAAQASTYGDMRSRAREHTPEFYEKSLKNAEVRSEHAEVPVSEDAEKAFEEAINEIEKLATDERNIDLSDVASNYLTAKGNIELKKMLNALENNSLKTLFEDEPVSQDRVLAAAVALSPAVAGAKDNYRAALNRYEQTVFLDQLLYQYLNFTESLNTLTSSNKNKRMVQMSYPLPGMVSLKGEIVQKDVDIARVEYEKTVRDVLKDLKLTYADLLYLNTAVRVTGENLELARKIERVVTSLYSTGKAAYTSMVKISIRVDKLGTMLETLSEKKAAAEVKLAELAGLPDGIIPGELIDTGLPQAPELAKLRELALAQRQELLRMELMLSRMDTMIEMASRKLFPDYSLGLSYFQNQEIRSIGSQGMMPSFMVRPMGAGAKPDFANENAYIQEMRDKRSGMAGKLEDMRNRTFAMVDMYYAQFTSASNTAETYRKSIVIKAQNAYDASLTAYTSGAVSFIDLLDAHRGLLDQTLAFEDAKRKARHGLAFLERTTGGQPVPRKGDVSK